MGSRVGARRRLGWVSLCHEISLIFPQRRPHSIHLAFAAFVTVTSKRLDALFPSVAYQVNGVTVQAAALAECCRDSLLTPLIVCLLGFRGDKNVSGYCTSEGYCILTRRVRRRGDAELPGHAGTEAGC